MTLPFTAGPIVADSAINVVYLADQTDKKILAVNTGVGATTGSATIAAAASALAVSYDDTKLFVSEPSLNQVEELSLPSLAVVSTLHVGLPLYNIAQSAHGELFGTSDTGLYEFSPTGVNLGTINSTYGSYVNSRIHVGDHGTQLAVNIPNVGGGSNDVMIFDVSGAKSYPMESFYIPFGASTDLGLGGGNIITADPSSAGYSSTYETGNTITHNTVSNAPVLAVAASVTGSFVAVATSGQYALIDVISSGSSTPDTSYPIVTNSGVASGGLVLTPNQIAFISSDGHTFGVTGISKLNVSTSPLSASGAVFTDTSGSGGTTVSGPGIAGVTVFEDANSNFVFDAGDPSTVTAADGSYTLVGVPAGFGQIGVQIPSGYVGTGNYSYGFATVSLTGPVNISLFKTMIVNGLVYNDANLNGRLDVGEAGMSNVQVFNDLNRNGMYNSGEPTTVTDASGLYSLPNLAPSQSYPGSTQLIEVVAFSGYLNETAVDSVATHSGQSLTLMDGLAPKSYASGATLLTQPGGSSIAIGGQTVYADLNNNGLLDTGEPAAVSSADGSWSLGSLPAGTVVLRLIPANGYNADGADNQTVKVGSLAHVTASFKVDAPVPALSIGSISGLTYTDVNVNNVFDAGEPLAVGRTVYIDLNDNGALDNGEPAVVTDSGGAYSFSALAAGSYLLRQVLPVNMLLATPAILVTIIGDKGSESSSPGVNLGSEATPAGQITGLVFNDLNGDGIQESGEPAVVGSLIRFDINGNGQVDQGDKSATATINGYSFNGVAAGTYTLTLYIPPAYESTLPSFSTNSVSEKVTVVTGSTTTALFAINQPTIIANAGGPYAATAGQTVTFDASASTISGRGQIVKYEWDPSYNGTSFSALYMNSGKTISYVVPASATGTHTVAVRETDLAGNVAIATGSLVISQAPTSIFGSIYNSYYNEVVYLDANRNNLLDSGEMSVVIGADPFQPTSFGFTNVPYGNYVVRQSNIGSLVQTSPIYQGGVAVTIDGMSATPHVSFINVSPATTNSISGAISGNSLQETLYLDANNDGIEEQGEHTTIVTADGSYTFSNVSTGSYIIRQVLGSKYSQLSPAQNSGIAVTVVSQAALIGENFINSVPNSTGSVSGTLTGGVAGETVYLDVNNNSTLDTAELSTTVTSTGTFSFASVPAGSYILRQVLPSGYTQTAPSNNAGIAITVTAGSALTDENFSDAKSPTTGTVAGAVIGSTAGETVFLDTNNNSTLDAGELSTTTTSTGAFSIPSVPAGSYILRQVLPSGYTQTSPASNAGIAITLAAGAALTGENFTDAKTATGGSVSGTVTGGLAGETIYLDTNNNSKLDSGEFSTTTTAAGSYSIAGVPAGATIVRQVLPTGYTQTTPTNNTGIHVTITGGSLTNQNFVDKPPATAGSVAGTVTGGPNGELIYLDANNNGAFDSGELPTTTTSTGSYIFSSVAPGSYVIRQLLGGGYSQTSPTGNAGIAVAVAAASALTGENFADTAVATTGSVAGAVTGGPSGEVVYLDANNNSVLDSGELSTNTTSTGTFSFAAVPAGSYVLRQVLTTGYTQTSPASNTGLAVTIAAGSALTGENFVDGKTVTTGSVAGSVSGGPTGEVVYLDANGNSVLDSGELSTTATSTGTYSFASVPAGSYVLRQVLAVGYTQTTPAGNAGIAVTVAAGSAVTGENFVDSKAATTGGSVSGTITGGVAGQTIYVDANNNSKLDTGELSATTSATGTYTIANIPAGATIVRQVLPTGYTQTTPSGGLGIHVTITNGGSLMNENFADKAPGTAGSVAGAVTGGLSGETVYMDANNNSVLDSTELRATTSSTGAFSFTGVPAGSYTLRQVLTGGYTQNSPASNGGIAVTVTAGSSLTGKNFTDKAPAVTKLTGTVIGTAGSYNNSGNTIAKAVDGSTSTFFDGQAASGNWVGLDLGVAKSISQIAYAPRSGYGSRMTGGVFQISTTADFSSGVTTIYTIAGTPGSSLTTVTLSSPVTARYIRYLSPNSSHGDISEFQVFG